MIAIKTLIAIPAMQTVPTRFLRSLESMRRLPDTYTSVIESTLIHDARNEFASIAIQNGFDRVLWLDSDMTFDPDTLARFSGLFDAAPDMDIACGLCFTRTMPTKPVIYKSMAENPDGFLIPEAYTDYPPDALFRVAACGFGCVMTTVRLLKDVWDKYGPPFSYFRNVGEDMSFCWRVRDLGRDIWCDSSIKAGHVGYVVFSEATWQAQQAAAIQNEETKQTAPRYRRRMDRYAGQGEDQTTGLTRRRRMDKYTARNVKTQNAGIQNDNIQSAALTQTADNQNAR